MKELCDADGVCTSNEYDLAGQTQTTFDGIGNPTRYSYDRRGNVVGEEDGLGNLTEFAYQPPDLLVRRTTPEGDTTIWNRDFRTGILLSRVDPHAAGADPADYTTSFEYGGPNNVTAMVLPTGARFDFEYDANQNPTHTRDETTSVIASRNYVREPSGEPRTITWEDGRERRLTLDAAGRIETEAVVDGGTTNHARRYTYDRDANRLLRVLDEATASEIREDSTIDPGSLLTAIGRTGASTSGDAYVYDLAGRLTSMTRGGRALAYTYDIDDALVQVDVDGAEAFAATFDSDGRRITTSRGAAERRFLVAPAMANGRESPHLITDAAGALLATYIYAGEHAISQTSLGATTYYLRDAVGSVVAIVDDAGAVVARFEYDAFGNALAGPSVSDVTGGDFRFQGMWLDAGPLGEEDQYFIRARVYDAATGRFTTRDPAQGRRRRPETYWAYVFANGNPENNRDPSGLLTMAGLNTGFIGALVLAAIANVTIRINLLEGTRRGSNLRCDRISYIAAQQLIPPPATYRSPGLIFEHERSVLYECLPPSGVAIGAFKVVATDRVAKPGPLPAAPPLTVAPPCF